MPKREYQADDHERPSSTLFYTVAVSMVAVNWLSCFLVVGLIDAGIKFEVLRSFAILGVLVTSIPAGVVYIFHPLLLPLAAIPNAIGWAYFVTVMHGRSKSEYRRRT